jgi:predicted ATPase/class 3 adenylate cyclase/Tfp pilus assembly protein PilF
MPGTRALLLTDLVDSTRLASEIGDERMAALWAAHDRVARDLLRAHDGREIDKSDGFLLLFDRAEAAVAYARDYHAAIAPLGVQARAGVHVGPVTLRQNDPDDVARGAKPLEVEGLAKSLAARVMGVARGGQTLATRSAAPEGALSHGHWMLKGVLDPIELFEVSGDGTPPADAAKAWRVHLANGVWLPVREVKKSLPAERDAFVGRERDLHHLAALLDEHRLVTVLGAAGTGKTRLVTRYAWTWLGDWPGGAWFADLSGARDLAGIAAAVARTLDLPLGNDPIRQLGAAIAGRGPCLVVLDNFEQVAELARETLGPWLDRAPDARFVATSRQVLALPGETTLALEPLDEAAAVELFRTRAAQAKSDFTFAEGDRVAIVELARLLDGLPLAIELAAARVRVMPPKMLLQRMSERFKLLAGPGARGERQSTLRAALDWSWNLLSADEAAALAQLSVFEGGFTLEAAEAVLQLGELWPMDAVQALVDKSLVRRVAEDRFGLLASVQEYAAERIGAARPDAEARHGAWFAAFGEEEAIEALDRHGGAERLAALYRERRNLMAASRRAAARGDAEVAARAACAAWRVAVMQGGYAEAIAALEAALAAGPERGLRARASRSLASALMAAGRVAEAAARLENEVALARESGDAPTEAVSQASLGLVYAAMGRAEAAVACLEAALPMQRAAGDRAGAAGTLSNLGVRRGARGEIEAARAMYLEALGILREVGHGRFEVNVLGNLGMLAYRQGRHDEARARFEEALGRAREIGYRVLEGQMLTFLAFVETAVGRFAEARARFEAAIALFAELGDPVRQASALANFAIVPIRQASFGEARAVLDRAEGLLREGQDVQCELMIQMRRADLASAGRRADEAEERWTAFLAAARARGDQRLAANAEVHLGGLALAAGRPEEAERRFETALAVSRAIGSPHLEHIVTAHLASVHAALGRASEARAVWEAAIAGLRQDGALLDLAEHLGAYAEWLAPHDRARAAGLLDEAERVFPTLGLSAETALGRSLAQVRSRLRAG